MFLTEVMYFVFLGEVSPSRPLSPSHGPPHHISLTWPRYQQESCAQPLDLYFSTFLYELVLMSECYFFYRLLTGELQNYCSKLDRMFYGNKPLPASKFAFYFGNYNL